MKAYEVKIDASDHCYLVLVDSLTEVETKIQNELAERVPVEILSTTLLKYDSSHIVLWGT